MTEEKIPTWGGKRQNAGRKSTGRKNRCLYLTDEEYELVKEYIKTLKTENKNKSSREFYCFYFYLKYDIIIKDKRTCCSRIFARYSISNKQVTDSSKNGLNMGFFMMEIFDD